jgi:hypothetical protein
MLDPPLIVFTLILNGSLLLSTAAIALPIIFRVAPPSLKDMIILGGNWAAGESFVTSNTPVTIRLTERIIAILRIFIDVTLPSLVF